MTFYANEGNVFVAAQVPRDARRILDVGCGCGDTGRLLKGQNPDVWIEGITYNPIEVATAETVLDRVHNFDIEHGPPDSFQGRFDCLLFSHVLEHLRDPAHVLLRFLDFLCPNGLLVIAVPNILEWRTRLKLLRGNFTYADYGTLDRTHLRFFTFDSAERELISDEVRDSLTLIKKLGEGAVPLGPLRHLAFLQGATTVMDYFGVRFWPNLFAQQVVIVARKKT